jgi:hypothetical protein
VINKLVVVQTAVGTLVGEMEPNNQNNNLVLLNPRMIQADYNSKRLQIAKLVGNPKSVKVTTHLYMYTCEDESFEKAYRQDITGLQLM